MMMDEQARFTDFQAVTHNDLRFLVSPDLYPAMPGDLHSLALQADLDAIAAIARRDRWDLKETIIVQVAGSSTIVICGERRTPLATIRTRYQMRQLSTPAIVQAPRVGFIPYSSRDMNLAKKIAHKLSQPLPALPEPTTQRRGKKHPIMIKILACLIAAMLIIVLIDAILYVHMVNP